MSSFMIMADRAKFNASSVGSGDSAITEIIRQAIPGILVFGSIVFDDQEQWIGVEVEDDFFAGGIPVIDQDRLPEELKGALIAIPLSLEGVMSDALLNAVAAGQATVAGIALAYMLSHSGVSIMADDTFLHNPGLTHAMDEVTNSLDSFIDIDADEALLTFDHQGDGDVDITKTDINECEIASVEPTIWNVGGISLQLFKVRNFDV